MNQDITIQQPEETPRSKPLMASLGYAGGTFATMGVVDGLAHLGPTGLVFAAIGSFLAYRHGSDISAGVTRAYDSLDPRSKAAIHAVMARLGRPMPDEEESHAQPKDGAMRAMVDESEDEYLAPLPDPEPAPIFPAYPENERLDLGSVLATGQTFAPHFNALFGKGVIASAVQGSGKSQLLGRLIEQAAKCGVPMVVCDHKGEYAPVTELPFVNGLRAGSAELRGHTGQCEYFELRVGNADQFVALVMRGRYQAIIDLPSYGDSWLFRAEIVAEVGQALMRYAATQRKAGALLLPCLVALDEAQLYLPQNVNLLPPEAKKNTEILDSLNNAYFSLVSNGRSNGYTVVFATQSLTYIAKWAIKSCQIKIFGRHVEKNDLDMCGETISPKIATRVDIETFAPGVGVVFGFTSTAMVVKFDLRLSRDDSETPGLERLRMPVQRKSAQPVQSLPDLSTLFDEEVESVSFEELCDAVAEMAMAGESDSRIMRHLDLNREDYLSIAHYIRSHWSEFRKVLPTSVPTSQVSSVPTSNSTSTREKKLHLVNGHEGSNEEGRSGIEVEKSSEVDAPGNFELTEREIRMGEMFFVERVGINVIMKEFFPGVTGGDRYQKASAEINDALRKYVEVKRGA